MANQGAKGFLPEVPVNAFMEKAAKQFDGPNVNTEYEAVCCIYTSYVPNKVHCRTYQHPIAYLLQGHLNRPCQSKVLAPCAACQKTLTELLSRCYTTGARCLFFNSPNDTCTCAFHRKLCTVKSQHWQPAHWSSSARSRKYLL